jgi:PadR family transcriptional regulator, regulatory protein AphA
MPHGACQTFRYNTLRTMQGREINLLGYLLLGLIQQKAASGYDLRKIFSGTPMGRFSDSPGAIYPALAKLEGAGLLAGRVEARRGLRQRKVLRITRTGLSELKAWLKRPVELDDVVRKLDVLMLRFAFLGNVLGDDAARRFLRQLEAHLKTHVASLKEFLEGHGPAMPVSGRLALESGAMGYEAQLRWASRAVVAYERLKEKVT